MNEFFRGLPTTIIGILAIIAGFIFIIINDPPKTPCDNQMEIFKQSQSRFLFPRKEKSVEHKPLIETMTKDCRENRSPGGCLEYFDSVRKALADLRNFPGECSGVLSDSKEVKTLVYDSLELMARLAWGDKPPLSYVTRHGWYDTSDIALFCDIQEQALRIYGQDSYAKFRETTMQELPESKRLSRDDVWQRTLFATKCASLR